jgi:hypothetical protein
MRTRHQATLAALRDVEAHVRNLPHKPRGGMEVLRAGFRLHQAYLDYCDELEAELSKETAGVHTS